MLSSGIGRLAGPGRRASLFAALTVFAGLVPSSLHASDFAVGLEVGYFDLTNARQSAQAIFDGTSGGLTFGADVRLGLDPHFFVGLAGRFFQREGERVFIAGPDDPVFRLGHPLKVRVVPLYAMLGYRLLPTASLSPYVALGGGLALLHEESTVGGIADPAPIDQTKATFLLLAGVEYGRGSLRVGVEGSFARVPNAIGIGGVSQIYGETDMGGFSVLGRVVFVP